MSRTTKLAATLVLLTLASACSSDPEEARKAYIASGDKFVAENKLSEAVIQYRNAVQKAPRSGEARLKLAETYGQIGDVPNSYREYLRAADLLPDQHEVQIKAVSFQLMFGQFEDAKTRA